MVTKYRAETFNVFDIYKTIFGYRALPFPAAIQGLASSLASRVSPDRLSKLGAALFKRTEDGTEAFCPVEFRYRGNRVLLPYATISIRQQKTIVKTSLIERKGIVKELIQESDDIISVRGIIMGEDLPVDPIIELRDLYRHKEPVQLLSAFAEIFLEGTNDVVIESLEWPDMQGIIGAQAFIMELSSDSVLEIEQR